MSQNTPPSSHDPASGAPASPTVFTTLPPKQNNETDESEELPLPEPPQPPSAPKKRYGLYIVLIAFVAVLLPSLMAFALLTPLPIATQKTVVIPRRSSVQDIALRLQFEGIEPNRLLFRAVVRYLANDSLQAGEYQFTPGQNLIDVVVMMRDGRSIARLFTVPEGLTSSDVVNLLKNEQTLTGELNDVPPEGSLLPETYRYNFGDARAGVIERMQKSARDTLRDLWNRRDPDLPIKSVEEAVIAASIIEKETGKKAEERARVAGVFYNRLRQNMRLQSDPTVIYALTKGQKPLGRELTHDDLAFDSPYNTYVKGGLPPGPICNPGRASLEAALHPEKNDFLYFVADGTGGHAFAKDLAEHNKNVNHWLCLPKP